MEYLNKGCHTHQRLQPSNVSRWALRKLRKERIPAIRQPSDCSHSLLWALRKLRIWKYRILALDSWDAYQRNEFSELRLLYLPIHRKVLINSLTWDIWFSLISNNLLMFPTTCPLLQNFYITWFPPTPSPPWSSSLRVAWGAASWACSPKNSHWIKHNSQLSGCEYFLSRQVVDGN